MAIRQQSPLGIVDSLKEMNGIWRTKIIHFIYLCFRTFFESQGSKVIAWTLPSSCHTSTTFPFEHAPIVYSFQMHFRFLQCHKPLESNIIDNGTYFASKFESFESFWLYRNKTVHLPELKKLPYPSYVLYHENRYPFESFSLKSLLVLFWVPRKKRTRHW